MNDINYKKALCQVDYILQNTDKELVNNLPVSFLLWIKENKLVNYVVKITNNISLEEQQLLPETEAILSLIFRKYWATNEEKQSFKEKDKKEFMDIENNKKKLYPSDIKLMLENRIQNYNPYSKNNSLIKVNKKITLFRKIINKIKSFFIKY